MDQFLTDNRDAVREFLVKGSDPVSVQQLGEDFEQHVVAALAARGPDGVSANDRLADGVQAIKIGQERLHRLAYGNDLSTEEKQLRRVLGLILQQAHKPQQS